MPLPKLEVHSDGSSTKIMPVWSPIIPNYACTWKKSPVIIVGNCTENAPCMHDAQENPAQSLAIGTVIDDTKLILGTSHDTTALM